MLMHRKGRGCMIQVLYNDGDAVLLMSLTRSTLIFSPSNVRVSVSIVSPGASVSVKGAGGPLAMASGLA